MPKAEKMQRGPLDHESCILPLARGLSKLILTRGVNRLTTQGDSNEYHTICFYGEIMKIIPNLTSLLLMDW